MKLLVDESYPPHLQECMHDTNKISNIAVVDWSKFDI